MVKQISETSAGILEIAGIAIILLFGAYAIANALYSYFRKKDQDETFKKFRNQFGRGVLLGLEFLVGADIIQTVAVDLSFESVGLLAIIVVIRTFLSFTLELELTGKWPWQEEKKT